MLMATPCLSSKFHSITEDVMRSFDRCLVTLILCVFCAAVSTPVDAQTASINGGAILGVVTDSSGAAVPGVKVTLSGSAMVTGTKTVLTDQSGAYRFLALAPGNYNLKFEAAGFGTETRQGVHVSLGFTATVNSQMTLGSVTQTVTVSGATSAIDLQENNITTNLGDEQVKDLPGSRDVWSVLSLAPAVAQTKMDVGGSDALTQEPYTVYGLGSSASLGGGGINRGEIEGMVINEGSGGGGSEFFYVDTAAMQTISVNTANNSPEMPQPGVLTNMFIKTGGNEYHGDIDFEYENASMEGHNIDAAQIAALTAGGVQASPAVPLADVNRLNLFADVDADVGGYLKKDKLWWYFAYGYTQAQQNYPTLNVTQTSWSPSYVGKATYALTPKQQLVFFYTHSNKLQPDYLNTLVIPGGRQAGALESAETSWNSSYPSYTWAGEYTYTVSPYLLFQFEAGQYFTGWTRLGKSSLDRIEDVASNYVSGGLQNTENDRHRPQARGSVSYVHSGWLGTHNFKFGAEYMRDTDFNPWNGLGLPGALAPTVPCPSQIPNAALGSTCQVVTTLNNGLPLNAYFYAVGPYEANNGNSTTGIYGIDTWQINDRLTLNIGLRFDRQNIFSQGETGPNGTSFGAANYVAFHDYGPRLGVSYDLSGHGTSVVKLSFGHYFNYPAADYGSGLNPDADGWYYEYQWDPTAAQLGGRSGDTPDDHYEPGDDLGALQASAGGKATTTFAPNLQLANTYQTSAYFEQQVGGFTLRTGLVYNLLRDIAGTVNADRPLTAYNVPETLYVPGPNDVATAASPTVTVWNLAAPTGALNVFEDLPENDHYYNWEVTALKQNTGKMWTLMGSFNYTWNYVRNFPSGFGTGSSFTPNQLINTVGCENVDPCTSNGQAQFYNWQGKILSTIQLPRRFRITPIFRVQSGIPFGRYFSTSGIIAPPGLEPTLAVNGNVLAEPYGSERTPTLALFDIRVDKEFLIKERYGLTGFVDVYNIFNDNGDQAVTAASGSSFLTPSNITPPRVARFGVQFAF